MSIPVRVVVRVEDGLFAGLFVVGDGTPVHVVVEDRDSHDDNPLSRTGPWLATVSPRIVLDAFGDAITIGAEHPNTNASKWED